MLRRESGDPERARSKAAKVVSYAYRSFRIEPTEIQGAYRQIGRNRG
jgi:hypothetical protein